MKVSIGMMVKNEEKYLEQCLSSLIPILDKVDSELVIVDTGSNDKTVEIAKKFTDKIHFHKWDNNFAEMRNITISYCSGEWFFCIDGDEIVEDCNEIINFFNLGEYKNYKSATFNVKNITDLNNQNNYTVIPSLRMFEKDKEFKYIGAIHNQPICKQPTKIMNIWIKHFGYVNTDKELMDKKFQRTSELLKKELKKDPGNIYYMYQLSVSYAMHGDIKEGLEIVEKAYSYIKENRISISEHFYVLQQLCLNHLDTNNYFQVIKYASEWLIYEEGAIDAYYCLGYSQLMLSENKEAIINLERYVEMIENNTYCMTDTRITNYTIGKINSAYYYLSLLYRKINDVEKAIYYLLKIKGDEYNITQEIVTLCVRNKYYKELYKYYDNLLKSEDNSKVNDLFLYIENEKLHLDKNECNEIIKLFIKSDNLYTKLNNMRISYENKDDNLIEDINRFVDKEGMVNLPDYFGDLIFFLIDLKENITETLSDVTYKILNNYLAYIANKYENFSEKVYEYLKVYGDKEDFKSIRINKELFRYIILLNKLNEKKIQHAFLKYIDIGIKYINILYTPFILENERYNECRNEEEGFFIFMRKAQKCKKSDRKLYIEYLRKALEIYPYMKNAVKLLLEEVKEVSNIHDDEFEAYKIQVKNTIKLLIDSGRIEDAEKVINEYEDIVKDDIEIYSFKAIICILQDKFTGAEKILQSGLELERYNFDLLYNLAYIYENSDKINLALECYGQALINSKDENITKVISNKIEELKNEYLEKIVSYSKEKHYLNALEGYEKLAICSNDINYLSGIANQIRDIEKNYKSQIIKLQENANKKKNEYKKSTYKYKYLHIMIDSPYSKKFIRMINDNFDSKEHYFLITSSIGKVVYVDIPENANVSMVDISKEESESSDKILEYADISNKIFIHFLTDYMCDFLTRYNIENEVNWVLWGGDLYNFIDMDLYDSSTAELLNKKFGWMKRSATMNVSYIFRRAAIRKFTNIYTEFDDDFKPIKEKFITAAEHGKMVYPNPVNFVELENQDIELDEKYRIKQKYKFVIQVGNSGDPTNNHLEILRQLKKFESKDFCILAPLSYGESNYIKAIIEEGKGLFGESFIPVMEFLKPEEYFELLKQVDVCIMNHNRQQASSNMSLLLYLGKKLYVKDNLSTAREFKRQGAKVFSLSELGKISFDKLVEMSSEDRKLNKNVMIDYFSDIKVLNYMKAIFAMDQELI